MKFDSVQQKSSVLLDQINSIYNLESFVILIAILWFKTAL